MHLFLLYINKINLINMVSHKSTANVLNKLINQKLTKQTYLCLTATAMPASLMEACEIAINFAFCFKRINC